MFLDFSTKNLSYAIICNCLSRSVVFTNLAKENPFSKDTNCGTFSLISPGVKVLD